MTMKKVVVFSKKKIYGTSIVLGSQQPEFFTVFTHRSPEISMILIKLSLSLYFE